MFSSEIGGVKTLLYLPQSPPWTRMNGTSFSHIYSHTPSRGGGGQVNFDPPFWPRTFLNSPMLAKKYRDPFSQFDAFSKSFKNLTVLNGFSGFLSVFNGFQCWLHKEKKPDADEKFLTAFFCTKQFLMPFSFSSEDPQKNWWRCMYAYSEYYSGLTI